ncbi:MAG TPA: universal stress protein [Nitrospiraceae bacterium]|nr:universal stress protein [Nitrospiraceae bacterium]
MDPLITRVLLATDFSHGAEQALSHALAIASSWKAELHILHVLEFLPGMNPEYPVNQMYLEQLRNEAAHDMVAIETRVTQSGLPARTTIDVGVPSRRIEAVRAQTGASLIVMGTHGRTGLEHVLVGSTAERVVRTASCPVLTVKARGDAPSQATLPADALRFQRLLIPVDFSASSLEALEYGVQLAKHFGASVTLLHTLEPVAYGLDFTLGSGVEWRTQKAYVEGRLEILRALCTSNGIKAEQVLKAGTPGDSIRDYAEQQPPDLVIMGTHGRRGISRILSGSVAETLLRLAPCPVLTVRTPVFGSDHERIMPAGEEWLKADT